MRARIAPPDAPFAIVEKQKGAMRLVAVSQAAHLLGLTPGLALADARARVPDLPAFDHDPAGDAALLARLADACLRYTPRVMVAGQQGVLLDIAGCAHLWERPSPLRELAVSLAQQLQSPTPLRLGIEDAKSHCLSPEGEREIAADLACRLRDSGLTARLAFSVSADAALALAVHGLEEGQAGRLPVTALVCDTGVHHALRRAGLTHIRDLASRPRTMLAARFGEGVTRLLARLLGEIDTPIIPRRSLAMIRSEARFAEPIAHADSVRQVLAELLGDAIRQLEQRGEGARAITVILSRCDGQKAALGIETAAPTRDPALLMRLFAERIDSLADPLDPGFGYDDIALEIRKSEPLGAVQTATDNREAQTREALAALLARLSTRLGPERVTCWRHVDTHVPEEVVGECCALESDRNLKQKFVIPAKAGIHRPPVMDSRFRGNDEMGLEAAPSRPLLLLDPPQPVEAIAEVPDGPPYRFRWKGTQHRVARHEGPERIAMPWWQGRRRAARLTRDYYRVEDSEGRRFWLFRHGLYEEKPDPVWYMHGLFA